LQITGKSQVKMNLMQVWKLLLPAFMPGMLLAAEVVRSADAETGLRRWLFVEGNLEIELVQRLPDQTRGFFLARGFPAAIADEIAVSCIFQTIIRNTGGQAAGGKVSVDLAQWRVMREDGEQGIRLKEPWMASWPETAVGAVSRLAFQWALFPTRQEFQTDDYNWGMTAFGLPPGAVFDLDIAWQENGKAFSARLDAIECAPDVERLQ
jgi:hypothetical protein